ncbi:MAG: PhoH family protein [Phycisphaerales bacterium]|jgi:phosphate starvation-inducible PhoH-like protein|nr:PhoH family protein [Phycisphaerales bacterium]
MVPEKTVGHRARRLSSRKPYDSHVVETTIRIQRKSDRSVPVLGPAERNLKLIREALGVHITSRDGEIQLKGPRDAVAAARRVIERLLQAAVDERSLTRQDVLDIISDQAGRPVPTLDVSDEDGQFIDSAATWDGSLDVYSRGKLIRAKTTNQQRYLDSIRDHDLVFSIGPAGTGKTYLAVAAAVHLLKTSRVTKVILARPAVEAGEKLGFLPGDMQAKVNPYLRPLLDALHDMMDYATVRRFMENDVVEVVPLAFMRGRTLNNAVIILDEAQNATRGQMKMFLTRMGHGSKMIVTGDTTQIDLEEPRESGLVDAAARLAKTPGVGFVSLDRSDVVRHPLVQRVIDAYEEDKER